MECMVWYLVCLVGFDGSFCTDWETVPFSFLGIIGKDEEMVCIAFL